MKRSDLVSLEVYTDGGCSNNGNANGSGVVSCYGSYLVVAVTKDGKQVRVKHEEKLPMPHLSTNNEAEYQAFVNGEKYLVDLFSRTGIDVPVMFKVDSDLVFTQVMGIKKCKAENLKAFCFQAREQLAVLEADVQRISGDDMKIVLGH